MNTLSLTNKSSDMMKTEPELLDEVWFDEAPQSSAPRSSSAPVSVGEFLGDPLADAWLR